MLNKSVFLVPNPPEAITLVEDPNTPLTVHYTVTENADKGNIAGYVVAYFSWNGTEFVFETIDANILTAFSLTGTSGTLDKSILYAIAASADDSCSVFGLSSVVQDVYFAG